MIPVLVAKLMGDVDVYCAMTGESSSLGQREAAREVLRENLRTALEGCMEPDDDDKPGRSDWHYHAVTILALAVLIGIVVFTVWTP